MKILNQDRAKIQHFMKCFEEVFHEDWAHSKGMMGIQDESAEQQAELAKVGLESIHMIEPDGTFLEPKVDDEIEDWGSRGALLAAYRNLKKAGY